MHSHCPEAQRKNFMVCFSAWLVALNKNNKKKTNNKTEFRNNPLVSVAKQSTQVRNSTGGSSVG